MDTLVIVLIVVITLLVFNLYAQLYDEYKTNKEIKAVKEKERNEQAKIFHYLYHQVELAETLNDLFILHIKLWGAGIRNKNLGPDKVGMFRTDNILMMNPNEVYLGNIHGLFTLPMTKWNECKDEEAKNIVTKQYRDHLLLNLNLIGRELGFK